MPPVSTPSSASAGPGGRMAVAMPGSAGASGSCRAPSAAACAARAAAASSADRAIRRRRRPVRRAAAEPGIEPAAQQGGRQAATSRAARCRNRGRARRAGRRGRPAASSAARRAPAAARARWRPSRPPRRSAGEVEPGRGSWKAARLSTKPGSAAARRARSPRAGRRAATRAAGRAAARRAGRRGRRLRPAPRAGAIQAAAASASAPGRSPGASAASAAAAPIVPGGRKRHRARRRVRLGAALRIAHPHAVPDPGRLHGAIVGAGRRDSESLFCGKCKCFATKSGGGGQSPAADGPRGAGCVYERDDHRHPPVHLAARPPRRPRRAGNRYYEARRARRRRRAAAALGDVCGRAEASKVPPEWHCWLHYTTEAPLPEARGSPGRSRTSRTYRHAGELSPARARLPRRPSRGRDRRLRSLDAGQLIDGASQRR